jgi:hypothetical protein
MKNFFFLFVVCSFCAASALAQAGGGSANVQPHALAMPSHTLRASQTALSTTQNLLERSGSTSARGERPLWEVMQLAPEAPLGDAARALKAEHASAKKARVVWSN